MPLRYSDFNIGSTLRNNEDALRERADWLGTAKERLNKHIARQCDGIVAGLYEYWVCYHPLFPTKTTFIPYPMEIPPASIHPHQAGEKIRVFIGINKTRSEYKGTDIMLSAAQEVAGRHPEEVELVVAESLPFKEYQEQLNGSDVMLDQLYSYTPSMNSLLAMSKGIICIGGGEPENYDILSEQELRPILNVEPSRESVVSVLENLVRHPDSINKLKAESVEYIRRHHEYVDVARRYAKFYTSLQASISH